MLYNAFGMPHQKLKTPKVLNQSQALQCLFSRKQKLRHSLHVCFLLVSFYFLRVKLTTLGLSFTTIQLIKTFASQYREKGTLVYRGVVN